MASKRNLLMAIASQKKSASTNTAHPDSVPPHIEKHETNIERTNKWQADLATS